MPSLSSRLSGSRLPSLLPEAGPILIIGLTALLLVSCHAPHSKSGTAPRAAVSRQPPKSSEVSKESQPGDRLQRRGDEIMVAGQLFHTGTRVVLWTDPGGFDAYRVQKRFGPMEESEWPGPASGVGGPQTPNRYGTRRNFPQEKLEQVRGGGWELADLQNVVDQFVIHYDGCFRSRDTFEVLHDQRGLSAHFLLDIDGTIYQTLDVKERAWHATIANDRSIGIEIANLGALPAGTWKKEFGRYQSSYGPQALTEKRVNDELQEWMWDRPPSRPLWSLSIDGTRGTLPGIRGPLFGRVHDQVLWQMDFTIEQYNALAKLTMALTRIFPNMPATYPQDEKGQVLTRQLTPEEFAKFQGIIGHYHIQSNKIDPGPAFQWQWLMRQVKAGKVVEPMKISQ